MKLIEFFKERTEDEIVEKFVQDFSKKGFAPDYLMHFDISNGDICNPNCDHLDYDSECDFYWCTLDGGKCPYQNERSEVFAKIIREFLNSNIE